MEDGNNFNLVPENQEEQFNVEFGEVITLGGGGTNDFNQLSNRPSYDNQTMTGTTNIPKVPTKTSDLDNDSAYQTSTEVNNAIDTAIGQIDIPSKTSELINDGSNGESTYIEANALATVATSGSYSDLNGTPTIPTVNDATLTITQNGTSKGTFTANDSDDTTIEVTDTTYSAFTGTDGVNAGSAGLVPAPMASDDDKYLKSDGTWATVSGGGSITPVQTTGTSTTDVMSQNAVSTRMYPRIGVANDAIGIVGANETQDSSAGFGSIGVGASHRSRADNSIAIGYGASVYAAGAYSMAIGNSAKTEGHSRAVALGNAANAANDNSVAIGTNSVTTRSGEVNVGAGTSGRGYNSTNYRVIGGVHDGQTANDAVTVGQVNATIDAINTAMGTSIPHIGSST